MHPNSVKLELTGESGRTLEVIAASIGGGRIEICEIDGLTANFSGDYPTPRSCIIDQPGHNYSGDIHACPQIGQHRNDAVIPCKPRWKCSYGHRVIRKFPDALKWLERDGRNFESNLSEFTVNKFLYLRNSDLCYECCVNVTKFVKIRRRIMYKSLEEICEMTTKKENPSGKSCRKMIAKSGISEGEAF